MATTLEYAKNIYSYVPAREKKFLKDQAPRAKKLGHKMMNLLQHELHRAKTMDVEETPRLARVIKLERELLTTVLSAVEKAIAAVQAFENMDAPVVLTPVPHHHHEVIPDSMLSKDQPRASKKKRATTKKSAGSPMQQSPAAMRTQATRNPRKLG